MNDHTFMSIFYSTELRAQRVGERGLFAKQSLLVEFRDPSIIKSVIL
jgi:hypothetical protein